jgi:hypothetical protein
MHIVLQKHCQFLSTTIVIPAENTRQSEKPGQNSEIKCMVMHLNGEDVLFTDFMWKMAKFYPGFGFDLLFKVTERSKFKKNYEVGVFCYYLT